MKNPTDLDDPMLARVVGYMKGTIKHVRKISSEPFDRVKAYIDAAHAAHEDRYGHSGGVIMVGGTAVECITRKQKCVARDSTIIMNGDQESKFVLQGQGPVMKYYRLKRIIMN